MSRASATPEGLRLKDDLEVVYLGDRLLVCVGSDTFELSGPDARMVGRLIDLIESGAGPSEARATLGLSRAEFNRHWSDLTSRGCFADSSAPARDPPPSIVGPIGLVGAGATAVELLRLLRANRVESSVVGDPWGSNAGSSQSAQSGRSPTVSRSARVPVARAERSKQSTLVWSAEFDSWIARQAAVVVATGAVSPATQEAVNARCGEHEIPWLSIREGARWSEVGPPIRPPHTPCYLCLALRGVLNRGEVGTIERTLSAADSAVALSADEWSRLISLLALGELRGLLAKRRDSSVSRVLRVDRTTGEVRRLPVLKLPNCPGCEWWTGA